ncbi:hypothetical protein JW877_01725 [bacterium]|nr:hypothetical protein [bacterium]
MNNNRKILLFVIMGLVGLLVSCKPTYRLIDFEVDQGKDYGYIFDLVKDEPGEPHILTGYLAYYEVYPAIRSYWNHYALAHGQQWLAMYLVPDRESSAKVKSFYSIKDTIRMELEQLELMFNTRRKVAGEPEALIAININRSGLASLGILQHYLSDSCEKLRYKYTEGFDYEGIIFAVLDSAGWEILNYHRPPASEIILAQYQCPTAEAESLIDAMARLPVITIQGSYQEPDRFAIAKRHWPLIKSWVAEKFFAIKMIFMEDLLDPTVKPNHPEPWLHPEDSIYKHL